MKRLILGAVLLSFVVTAVFALLPAQTRTQPTQAATTAQFDHGDCQYPDRWSNPVDGCDNTDPAVPECIKAAYSQTAEQKCIAAFVKAHEEPAKTTKPKKAEPAPTVNYCGGK